MDAGPKGLSGDEIVSPSPENRARRSMVLFTSFVSIGGKYVNMVGVIRQVGVLSLSGGVSSIDTAAVVKMCELSGGPDLRMVCPFGTA